VLTYYREKLEIVKIAQKEKKLIIKQAQYSTNIALKRRSLELQKIKEERSKGKELARQNSVQEEIRQFQVREDEYHKMVILHVSVGIMLAIWLKVMDFSLLTLPFLSLTPPSSSSYFPSSISFLYNLVSWANTTRIFYAISLLVVLILLWMFVSSLAPYVVLLFVFMHAWESLFRAGIYFFFLWVSVSLSFPLMRKVTLLLKYKAMRLALLYSFHLLIAGIVGGVVAHGDPLNPYRIPFYPDTLAERLFSYVY